MNYLWSNGATGDSTEMKQNGIAWVKVTDPVTQAVCSSRDSINVSYQETCVGIMERSGIVVSTYPNPASNYVKINLKGISNSTRVNLRIVSGTGQLVRNETKIVDSKSNDMQLNIHDIANGTYSLLISINREQISSTLIIAR